jgi:hypothetical protein
VIKVRFRVNLGSADATRLGIADFRECVLGAEVLIHETAAKALEAAGVIEPLPAKPEKPVEVRADPVEESPLAADPPSVQFKSKKSK